MSSRKKTGDQGEDRAESYLKQEGFKILGKNMISRYGEIDLVAQKDDQLYFVEVRKRIGTEYGSALESITPRKIMRIKKTAQYLLMKHSEWQQLVPFFSVIAIDETISEGEQIEFLRDAFE